MKKGFIFLPALLFTLIAQAQLCPGGGTSFATAVSFNPTWISGCANGTSCTGTPTSFDNRAACEPTTAMDACAPAPSCTTNSQDGSDIWFSFKATGTSATINLNQQISFVAVIQAFSGGPTCGSLVEIGCAKAGGPSSGVSLTLSGLVTGQIYYFRVFGSANAASQRTGTFCFCGTSGLASITLPVVLGEFRAIAQKNRVILKWNTASELDNKSFEIERSTDGTNFTSIATITGNGTIQSASNYEFTDVFAIKGANYYRLKITSLSGSYEYSPIRMARIDYGKLLSILSNPVHDKLVIDASAATRILIMNLNGQAFQNVQLKQGRNEIPVSNLSAGSYIVRSITDNESYKFNIIK